MGKVSKIMCLLLVAMLAPVSLLAIPPADAQSIPTPSVPEFTTEFVPVYNTLINTDPYTGEKNTVIEDLSFIELSIANQPYTFTNGSTFSIYYNVRIKGAFEERWTELYPTTELLTKSGEFDASNYHEFHAEYIVAANSPYYHGSLPQSDSTYTVINLPADNYPPNGQVDIQVKAMLGVNSTYFQPAHNFIAIGGDYYPAVAYVTSSQWSNTHTITIPSSDGTPAPSPTVPELPWFALLPLCLVVLLITLVLKRKNLPTA